MIITDKLLGPIVLELAEEANLEEIAIAVAKLQPLLKKTPIPVEDASTQTEMLAFYHSDLIEGAAWAALAAPSLLEQQGATSHAVVSGAHRTLASSGDALIGPSVEIGAACLRHGDALPSIPKPVPAGALPR